MRMQKHKSLYDKDFYKWSNEQAMLLKKGDFSKVDLENVIEEIQSLGRSEKHSLYSSTVSLLQHMLKIHFTSEKKGNSNSWKGTEYVARKHVTKLLEDNPSLKKQFKLDLEEAYNDAKELAAIESLLDKNYFPKECPWTLKEILGE